MSILFFLFLTVRTLKIESVWLPMFRSILIESYGIKMSDSFIRRDQATVQQQTLSNKFERARDLLLNGDLSIAILFLSITFPNAISLSIFIFNLLY
jgi:hypothetical protein